MESQVKFLLKYIHDFTVDQCSSTINQTFDHDWNRDSYVTQNQISGRVRVKLLNCVRPCPPPRIGTQLDGLKVLQRSCD